MRVPPGTHSRSSVILVLATSSNEVTPAALPPSFERVYAEEFDFVWRCLQGLGVQRASLDDAAQDVFVIVYRRLPSYEGRSSLRTFLISIAVNHCRHHLRAAARRRKALARFAEDVDLAMSDSPDVQGQRLADALARALDELPPDQRAVFVLAAIEGRSGAEIATILDVPENTVRTRLLRARQKLSASLGKEGFA